MVSRPSTPPVVGGITRIHVAADRVPLLSIVDDSQQVLHRKTSPVFDLLKPLLPLTTAAMTTLQGVPMDKSSNLILK